MRRGPKSNETLPSVPVSSGKCKSRPLDRLPFYGLSISRVVFIKVLDLRKKGLLTDLPKQERERKSDRDWNTTQPDKLS